MDEPPVQIYMQTFDPPRADRTHTSGYWRAEQELPPPALAADSTYFLGANGSLTTDSPVAGDNFDEYEYCPTVGTAGGLWSGGVPFGLPTDQRPDEIADCPRPPRQPRGIAVCQAPDETYQRHDGSD